MRSATRDARGGNAGSLTGEIHLDQGVHGPSDAAARRGEPLRGTSPATVSTTSARARHVVRAAGLERADEVPARAGHLRVAFARSSLT